MMNDALSDPSSYVALPAHSTPNCLSLYDETRTITYYAHCWIIGEK